MSELSIKNDDAVSAEALRASFHEISAAASDSPLVNPIRTLAAQLFLMLEKDQTSSAALATAIAQLEQSGFETRASAFHENRKPDTAEESAFSKLSEAGFEEFKEQVEATPVGVVFTAHPTFALSQERRALVADYPGDGDKEKWRELLTSTAPGPQQDITLISEHEDVLTAIENAKEAIDDLNQRILEIARRRFPQTWRTLHPAPVSLASWVGYDLDGRTDIHWGQSITFRLKEKALQLSRYLEKIDNIIADAPSEALSALRQMLAQAATATESHAANFSGDLSDPETVVPAANALTGEKGGRLTSLKGAIETLTTEINSAENDDSAMALMLLRAEMMACGLGVSRIHLRVNAAQVRSALKKDLGLDPDKDFAGRSALNVASSKASKTRLHAVNFGSVFLEQQTARRQFMLCAQILKHIDEDTPIRFLIAECEAPATVMGAVYLARLYGIDHKLDISPLFETPQALEGGGRFIERLLDEPEYCSYVKKRGRMSIQIGYSDSGRFMGQATASLGAERLQVLFARALAKANLPNVEALIFNTHGESMGRGAFPGTYRERMAHLSTPWVRSRFRHEELRLAAEFSFQGGEGFMHFQTASIAQGTVNALWSLAVEAPPPDFSDSFYKDINYSWDFYRALKAWQEALYDREDYRDTIFSFPQNLLYKTGSREVKRPRQGAGPPAIRSIRAIPHNALLQQIAIPVNVSGGIGSASEREPDRFIEHVKNSGRMRDLLKMTGRARDLTSVSILRAYSGLYSPSYWSALAGMSRKSERSEIYETVLQALQKDNVAESYARLADFLARDLRAYDAVRDELGDVERGINGAGVNADMGVLHAIRQALIARAVSLIASAPAFSRRHDVDRNDIIEMALDLRLEEAAQIMRKIFPKDSPTADLMKELDEKIDERDSEGGAYPEIHQEIIEPIVEIGRSMETISAALANHYRAFG